MKGKRKQGRRFLFFLGRVKGFQEPSPHPFLPFRQDVELGRVVGFLQDPPTFIVFMHREQNLLKALGQRRDQISSNGEKVAREPLRLRQHGDVRSSLLVKRGVVVVTKGSSRRLFCENQVDELFLRIGKDITNLAWGNIRFKSALLRKLESLPQQEKLRKKMA